MRDDGGSPFATMLAPRKYRSPGSMAWNCQRKLQWSDDGPITYVGSILTVEPRWSPNTSGGHAGWTGLTRIVSRVVESRGTVSRGVAGRCACVGVTIAPIAQANKSVEIHSAETRRRRELQ